MHGDHAAGHRRERNAAQTRVLDHFDEDFRLGKFADRLDQILISLAVAGHGPTDAWNHLKRIKFIEFVEPGYVNAGKFKAQKAAAIFKHAKRLRERQRDARHVANAEGDGDAVEALVRIRQLFGIALLESDGMVEPARLRALAADCQHLRIDVADGDAGQTPASPSATSMRRCW